MGTGVDEALLLVPFNNFIDGFNNTQFYLLRLYPFLALLPVKDITLCDRDGRCTSLNMGDINLFFSKIKGAEDKM